VNAGRLNLPSPGRRFESLQIKALPYREHEDSQTDTNQAEALGMSAHNQIRASQRTYNDKSGLKDPATLAKTGAEAGL
ncbi:MAG TPA: hypothetical protein VMR98_05125, partial [Candidatus Polarisedimenticolaceae bacterium]|nr:hypothetical protein [Candidatus Polarisedimenticolaceae bacterium]